MTKNNNFIEEELLDKPIKAKTLKKKLEKTCNCCGWDDNGFKHEPYCNLYENSLQNNKPSIELIEKLECPLGCGLLTEEQRRNNAIERIENKINEIIEKLNEHSVSLGEDNN
jgi:hypothetical protein